MYFDLNVPIPVPATGGEPQVQSKKGKGKQQQPTGQAQIAVAFSLGQLTAIEKRLDLLVHLGYTVVALTQTIYKKIDQRNHVNTLDPLLSQLKKPDGLVLLKRLTIVLDEDSEKGFGLTTAMVPLLSSYDVLALLPTTPATFSLACLTHSQPSNLTTHILALPLTLPRLPFHMKHTLVRTALRNGAVFEVCYAGALGEAPALDADGAVGEGTSVKRNWWAAAREVARVTKGKGLILSSGAGLEASLRAPRDAGNLITLLGLAQDAAHHMSTSVCKSLMLRAQTRKTYRAVLSEPKLVIPVTQPDNSKEAMVVEASKDASVVIPRKRLLQDDSLSSDQPAVLSISEVGGVGPPAGSAVDITPRGEQDGGNKKKRKKNKGTGVAGNQG